ncbi:MAG: hypothetical protein U0931_30345 [Vulcanimicrobiota bacterium]
MQIVETGFGDKYCLVGMVNQRPDLWLVRHQSTQKLAILQRFERPFPALASALNGSLPGFPKVLESWVERGQVLVLLERAEERSGALALGLSRRLQGQLDRLRQAMRLNQFGEVRPHDLCLNQQGELQLRWIPNEFQQPRTTRPQTRPAWPWLQWLWRRSAAC